MRQDWLLPYENPLGKRFEEAFFAALPKTPGVYRMIGRAGQVLYVGKAKNLRTRLRSYRNARPHEVSRKVIRMLNLVADIQWEPCESEELALLRENELLRALRPPFNVVNKRPEAYLFIALSVTEEGKAAFRLTTRPESAMSGEQVYGAYKGGGIVQRGILALLRVLWASAHGREAVHDREGAREREGTLGPEGANRQFGAREAGGSPRFDFPGRLLGQRAPADFAVGLMPGDTDRWVSHLHRFLKGTSPALLPLVTGALLDNAAIPPFYYRMMQEDLECLREFYERGPRRHRRLVRFRGRFEGGEGRLKGDEERIAQSELDDLLVRYHFRDAGK